MENKDLNKVDQNELKKQKRKKIIFQISIIAFQFVFSFAIMGFGLFWQKKSDLLGFTNAFYFSFAIIFTFGWMILMTNLNILSPFTYGMQSFFLLLFGKKHKKTYYEYIQTRKENPISKIYYIPPFIISLIHLIIAIVLHTQV